MKGHYFEIFKRPGSHAGNHKPQRPPEHEAQGEQVSADVHSARTFSPPAKSFSFLPVSTPKTTDFHSAPLRKFINKPGGIDTQYVTAKEDATVRLERRIHLYKKLCLIFLLAGVVFTIPFLLPFSWTMGIHFMAGFLILAAVIFYFLSLLFFIMNRRARKKRNRLLNPKPDPNSLPLSEIYARKAKYANRRFRTFLGLTSIFVILSIPASPLILVVLVTLTLALVNRHTWRKYSLLLRKLDQTEAQKQLDEIDRQESRRAIKHIAVSLLLLLAGIAAYLGIMGLAVAAGIEVFEWLPYLLSTITYIVFGVIASVRATKAWGIARIVMQRHKGEGIYPSRRTVRFSAILAITIPIIATAIALTLVLIPFLIGASG